MKTPDQLRRVATGLRMIVDDPHSDCGDDERAAGTALADLLDAAASEDVRELGDPRQVLWCVARLAARLEAAP